jgi:hypothetical protein
LLQEEGLAVSIASAFHSCSALNRSYFLQVHHKFGWKF